MALTRNIRLHSAPCGCSCRTIVIADRGAMRIRTMSTSGISTLFAPSTLAVRAGLRKSMTMVWCTASMRTMRSTSDPPAPEDPRAFESLWRVFLAADSTAAPGFLAPLPEFLRPPDARILCLGARFGTEVEVLRDLGYRNALSGWIWSLDPKTPCCRWRFPEHRCAGW